MDCSHQGGAHLARFIGLVVGMVAVIAPQVQGATRVFMVPDDVTIAPGATVVIQLWLEDTVSAGLGPLRSYQMATNCDALPIGETTGFISHNPSPSAPPIACADGGSPCVDQDNPDWVFAPVIGVSAENAGPCPDLPPRAGGAAVQIEDSQDVTDARYLTEAAYTASADASGDFGVTIQSPDLGDQGHSFLRAMNAANILFLFDDPGAVIHVVVDLCAGVDCSDLDNDCNDGVCDSGTGDCLTVAKEDGTGCTDDMNECTADECIAGSCTHPGVEAGTACGDPSDTDCDNPDTCDASGACQNNAEPNGTPCDDGDDCTEDDQCVDRNCVGLIDLHCLWGDITNPNGAGGFCNPECSGGGTDVDFDDVLCALEGFALVANCPCADIKGPPGDLACIPNLVIDFDDILTILNAFAGVYDCPDPCPAGPAPIMDPPGRDRAERTERSAPAVIELVPSVTEIHVGDTVEIDVYLTDVGDLRAYQIAVEVTGLSKSGLVVKDVRVDSNRADFVFAVDDALTAVDVKGARLGGVIVAGGVTPDGSVYLGTFVLVAADNARGVFEVKLRVAGESFLRDSQSAPIVISSLVNTTITIE
ncbi:MAG: hypothetical protein IID36_09955 [Planctomycetes bacterium]|nr:hypothetical protein [Planctomycetota bacterium]